MSELSSQPGPLGAFWRDLQRRTEPPNRVVKLVIAYKAIAAALLFVLAMFLFGLIADRELGLRLRELILILGLRTDHQFLRLTLIKLGMISPRGTTALGLVALFYALLEATEAIGLVERRRWAEYLVLLATVFFLPYEARELVSHFSLLRLLVFAGNLAIAVYFVRARRLFQEELSVQDASLKDSLELAEPIAVVRSWSPPSE